MTATNMLIRMAETMVAVLITLQLTGNLGWPWWWFAVPAALTVGGWIVLVFLGFAVYVRAQAKALDVQRKTNEVLMRTRERANAAGYNPPPYKHGGPNDR